MIIQAIIAGFVLASAIVFGCLAAAALITWILPAAGDLDCDEDQDSLAEYARRSGRRQ